MDQFTLHHSPASNPPDSGVIGQLKSVSLRASGCAYLVGDASLFAAGVMEKNIKGASAGLLWGLGGIATARYGNPSAEKNLELFCGRLGDYLKKQGVVIPDTPTTALLTQHGGVIDHVERFLYRYPSETLNTVYALGAAQLVGSGIGKKFAPDIISGILVGAGALAGLLINEKKPDPLHPPHTPLERVSAWAQEKPLRVSGSLYAVNNLSMFWAVLSKQKENPAQKSYMARFVTATSYLFGNAMLALSSRQNEAGHGMEVMRGLAEVSAQVIAAQPLPVQEALVQQIAGYLAAQPEIHQHADAIAAMLHAKLHSVVLPEVAEWQQKIIATPGPGTSITS